VLNVKEKDKTKDSMIWRLFKPRQIVKVSLPSEITGEEHKVILDDLNKRFGREYIMALVISPELKEIKIEIIK